MKLFDWIGSISYDKSLTLEEYNHTNYNPFMINKAFSQHKDTILYANEMNLRPNIDKFAHFAYMNKVIRKRKRYGKWAKETKSDDLAIIMEMYPHLSKEKAKQIEPLLKSEIEEIKKTLDKGGRT